MVYATILYNEKERICCIDRVGERAFLLDDFFEDQNLSAPKDMLDFIISYQDKWTDDIALFYGLKPELAIPLTDIKLIAPIPRPARNMVCMGKNYQAHAAEIRDGIFEDNMPPYPIYFTKPDHTVVGTGAKVLLHEEATTKLDYEVELAVIIGKTGINITEEDAESHIFGYTIANDISARELQRRHTQWFKGKSLTTHCPMGPWIVHKSMISYPPALELRSYVNDELRQVGNSADLIFGISHIISDLSKGYELRAGDIILTGTPSGVGLGFDPPKFLKDGDVVRCEIDEIGVITNRLAP